MFSIKELKNYYTSTKNFVESIILNGSITINTYLKLIKRIKKIFDTKLYRLIRVLRIDFKIVKSKLFNNFILKKLIPYVFMYGILFNIIFYPYLNVISIEYIASFGCASYMYFIEIKGNEL